MAKDIENIQSDRARLHEEILQIAEEYSDIIASADKSKQRWHDVFPDGMLLELCQEFECCPALVFIALDSIDIFTSDNLRKVSVRVKKQQKLWIFDSIMDTTRWAQNQSSLCKTNITSRHISQWVHRESCINGYVFSIANKAIYKLHNIQYFLLSQYGIYRIQSKYGSNYIGQTSTTFMGRWREHINKSQYKQYRLYQEIRYQGIENFSFSIVEIMKEASQELLLKRESRWIYFYNAYDFAGGLNSSVPRHVGKIAEEKIDYIYELLQTGMSNEEISCETGISTSTISDIRVGKRHQRPGFQYPIRSKNNQFANSEIYLQIAQMIMNTDENFKRISEIFCVSEETVRAINRGKEKLLKKHTQQ